MRVSSFIRDHFFAARHYPSNKKKHLVHLRAAAGRTVKDTHYLCVILIQLKRAAALHKKG